MPGCSTIKWSHWLLLSPSLTRLPVKPIAAARVKTDARDTIKLARLLAANVVPAVWMPPLHVRELRALVSLSLRLVNQRTQVRNRLHAVLHRHNLTLPPGKPFAAHKPGVVACLGPLGRESSCVSNCQGRCNHEPIEKWPPG